MTNHDLTHALKNGTPEEIAKAIFAVHKKGGDGDMWMSRAQNMLTKLLRGLCWMRDNQGLTLDEATILEFMALPRIIDLADPAEHSDMPGTTKSEIMGYLDKTPFFDISKGHDQHLKTQELHGYLSMAAADCLQRAARVA